MSIEKKLNGVDGPSVRIDSEEQRGEIVNILNATEKYSLFPKEVQELANIIKASDFYNNIVVKSWGDESYGEYDEVVYSYNKEKDVWVMNMFEHSMGSFRENDQHKDRELKDIDLVKEFQDLDPLNNEILLQPTGTHVGSLKFEFGWAHKNNKKEDAKEAFLPQT